MRKSSGRSSQDAEDAPAKSTRGRTSSDTRRRPITEAAKARTRRALDKKYTPEERARVAEAASPVDTRVFEAMIRTLVGTPARRRK